MEDQQQGLAAASPTAARPTATRSSRILGAFGGDEQEAFEASLAEFEQSSGIDVQYVSDQDFTTTIKQKVNSGDAPDIGLFPQPGGLLEFAADGKVQPIDTYLDYDAIDRSLVPGFLEAARYKGRIYGAPMRMAVKSIVWYPKPAYDDAKYTTSPASIQALSPTSPTRSRPPASPPWCMGWESDQATGWVGTDWLEEYMLRMYGPDVYDEWVSHRIPFNDERVVRRSTSSARSPRRRVRCWVARKGILNTAFGDAMTPAFDDPPKCMMHAPRQLRHRLLPQATCRRTSTTGSASTSFPPYDGGYDGQPILGGGDLAALFNGNDPDARRSPSS